MISYAQNFEDVILWRALKHVDRGFYVDIGAQDPVIDSVSLAFYEKGWRGVHVEPTVVYAEKLRQARPDETVIQAAIGTSAASIAFWEFPDTGLSTGIPAIAAMHERDKRKGVRVEVPSMRLSQLLSDYSNRDIHWLKIDAEGMEYAVIQSWQPAIARPWIVVVESTKINSPEPTFADWEPLLVSLGYDFVYFDGLNRFYVSCERPELKKHFGPGPNYFDKFALTIHAPCCALIGEETIRLRAQEAALGANLLATNEALAAAHVANTKLDAALTEERQRAQAAAVSLESNLVATNEALAAAHAENTKLDAALTEARRESAEQQAALEGRAAELTAVRQHVAQAEAAAAGLQRELGIMQHSASWRITKPLRWMRSGLDPLARRAAGLLGRACRTITLQIGGRRLHDYYVSLANSRSVAASGLFDRNWYLERNPDVRRSGVNPLLHYLRHGAFEGRDPNPLFDSDWYLDQNRDVRAAGVNPLVHYLRHGAAEGRDPNPSFDGDRYLDRNLDVRAAGMNPLVHYLRYGAAEGRDPNPVFESGRGLPQWRGQPYASTVEKWYDDEEPEISIVILNWNKSALTVQCLQHVWAHTTGYRYEIVVCDNGSTLQDFNALQSLSGRFRLLRVGINRFFGEGNNLGAQHAKGQFLVFLNNDAFVTTGWLEPLRAVFDIRDNAGAAGPEFVYPDGRLQEAGARIEQNGHAVQVGKFGNPDDAQYSELRAVDYCSAACLMVRRYTFERVLGFDLCWEPAYYEDVDLCFKIALLGLRTYYCPGSTVVHLEHVTTGDPRTGLQLQNIVEINRAKFMQRWGEWMRERRRPDHLLGVIQPITHRQSPAGPSVGILASYPLIPGGGEMYLLSLAEGLLPDARVMLITPEAYSRVRLLTMARELSLDLHGLEMSTLAEAHKMAKFDVFVVIGNTVLPPVAGLGRRNIYICQFPFPMERAAIVSQRQSWDDYELVVVYSEFVRAHVDAAVRRIALEEKSVQVIAPPVNLVDGATRRKRNIILSVGRIFIGGHNKRHDVMIEAFRTIVNQGRSEMELHIAGALHPEQQHREYFLQLQEMARGLPVIFHLNPSRQELDELYRDALVYWHGAGFGIDIAVSPEKCEHFGITVVEAMSAGCIPVVADRGGPAELVDPGRTGFYFRDIAELAAITIKVWAGRADPWVADIATAAVDRAQIYAKANFVKEWQQLLAAGPAASAHMSFAECESSPVADGAVP